ncbi:MAG: hypothetical protein M3003_13935 [Candidatus Dormibacteraeota bacterium]|nr:hypothetical protein [Candidatus Dormibacteraeota bacterium]
MGAQAPTPTPTPKKGHALRNIGIGCGGVLVLFIIIGIASQGSKPSSTNSNSAQTSQSSQSSQSDSPRGTPTPPPTAIPDIPLSGRGQTATQAFPIVGGGLTIFKANCACGGNFNVEIDDSNGQAKDIPINVIGAYSGSVAEGLNAGSYILKIGADAAWTITVSQPRRTPAASLPQTYAAHGQQVVGPFSSSGAVRLVAQHRGSSNFAVEVWRDDGSREDIPINEIGNYNGSTLSGLHGGNHWLGVAADGDWSIAVSKP